MLVDLRGARVLTMLGLALASLSSCGGEEEAPVMAAPMPPPPSTPVVPEPPPTPPPPPVPIVPGCEVAEASALRTDNLVGIASLLSEQIVEGTGDVPPMPTAFDARTALCPEGCDSTQPFVTRFTTSDEAQVHLVVPHRGGGFFVLPTLARGTGIASRCTDELRPTLRTDGDLVRLHLTTLVNEFIECDRDGDGVADPIGDPGPEEPECLSGCVFRDRTDRELLISPLSGRYVIVTRQLAVGAGEVEGVDRLADVPIRVEGAVVSIAGCGDPRRIDLAASVPVVAPAEPVEAPPQ
ncbi:MAG: hypothetical protein J0L92_31190 [Deltaproteobacteria bacterium]|nr:hypothetical protein [Deltaproteobacteria bacterium]